MKRLPDPNTALRATGMLLLAVAISACSIGTAPADGNAFSGEPAAGTIAVKLIALNDFHGNLEPSGADGVGASVPPTQRTNVGGAAFVAAHVAHLKQQNPNNVVIGAGDLVGASPLISSLFQDEPAVEVLNRAGLEFSAVGEHEFDRGLTGLRRLQAGGCRTNTGKPDPDSCLGAKVGTPVPFEGARFKWLAANIIEKTKQVPVLPAYGIKRFGDVELAFIGVSLQATPDIVLAADTRGLEFRGEAASVNALIPELRARRIESIVVLIHQGGARPGEFRDINACDGDLAGSPIARIVAELDDTVDLVVTGHTHAAYNCRLANASGRLVPVTSAGSYGRILTDIDVTIDPLSRDINAARAINRFVIHDDESIAADPAVADIVAAYKRRVTPIANAVIGNIASDLPATRADGACNMLAGNLIADAQLAATRKPELGGAQIAFINSGGVRSPGFVLASGQSGDKDGQVTYGEAFNVQPFGNRLVTMTLTSKQLKSLLEEQFAGCLGQPADTTRLMAVSSGFRYTWDGAAACGQRIREVSLNDGTRIRKIVDSTGNVLRPKRRWRITVNDFMADGGDGLNTLRSGTRRLSGVPDIDALVAYMARFKSPGAPYAPLANSLDDGSPRIRRTGGGDICPAGSETNP